MAAKAKPGEQRSARFDVSSSARRLLSDLNRVVHESGGRGSSVSRDRTFAGAPIRAIDGSVILGADGVWWFYMTLPTAAPYDLLPDAYKQMLTSRVSTLLKSLEGYEFHFITRPGELNVDKMVAWWKQYDNHWPTDDTKGRQRFNEYVDRKAAYLKDKHFQTRLIHLGVKLATQPGRNNLRPALATPFGLKNEFTRRLVPELRQILTKVQVAGFDGEGPRGVQPMQEEDLLNLIVWTIWPQHPRRPKATRSSLDPRAVSHHLSWLGVNDVVDLGRKLEIDPSRQKVHASYLVLAQAPFDVANPGNEFLRLIDVFGRPVPMSIRGIVLTAEQVKTRTANMLRDLSSHMQLQASSGGELAENEREGAAIAELHAHAETQQPTVKFTATAILADTNLDRLEEMEAELVAEASRSDKGGRRDQGVIWLAPSLIQLQLYQSAMPGCPVRPRGYTMYASCDSFGAGGLNVSAQLGSMGSLMGVLTGTGERGPLMVSPAASVTTWDTGTVLAVMGPPGGGKTTLLHAIAVEAAMQGISVLMRAGTKGDEKLFKPPPYVAYRQFDIGQFPGCLNPGLLDPDPLEAAEIMASFLEACSGIYDSEYHGVLFRYCKAEMFRHIEARVHNSEHAPDIRRVIDEMDKAAKAGAEEERRLVNRLVAVADHKRAAAFYGRPSAVGQLLSHLGPGFTVWGTEGWKYPETGSDERAWRPEERLAIAGLELQHSLGRLLALNRNCLSLTVDDEMWQMGDTRVQRASELVARFGRSMGSMIAIATHVWKDLPPDFMTYVSQLWVVGPNTREDAVMAATHLGYKPDEPGFGYIVDVLMKLGTLDGTAKIDELAGEAVIKIGGPVTMGRIVPAWTMGEGALVTSKAVRQDLAVPVS